MKNYNHPRTFRPKSETIGSYGRSDTPRTPLFYARRAHEGFSKGEVRLSSGADVGELDRIYFF